MTIKTREQIEDLKRQWEADPCWDLEDTEGFEAHSAELQTHAARYKRVQESKWQAIQSAVMVQQNRPAAEKMREEIALAEELMICYTQGRQADGLVIEDEIRRTAVKNTIEHHLRWAEAYAQIVHAELADLKGKSLAGV